MTEIELNGNVYRNLEAQVYWNKKQIQAVDKKEDQENPESYDSPVVRDADGKLWCAPDGGSDLESRVEALEGDVGDLQGDVEDIQEDIDDINTALSGKQDTMTVDASPTEDSTNPVQSGGVYTALAGKQNTLTAGTGIDITDDTISATGGGGANADFVDIDDYKTADNSWSDALNLALADSGHVILHGKASAYAFDFATAITDHGNDDILIRGVSDPAQTNSQPRIEDAKFTLSSTLLHVKFENLYMVSCAIEVGSQYQSLEFDDCDLQNLYPGTRFMDCALNTVIKNSRLQGGLFKYTYPSSGGSVTVINCYFDALYAQSSETAATGVFNCGMANNKWSFTFIGCNCGSISGSNKAFFGTVTSTSGATYVTIIGSKMNANLNRTSSSTNPVTKMAVIGSYYTDNTAITGDDKFVATSRTS